MEKVENLRDFVSIDEMVLSFPINDPAVAGAHEYFLRNFYPRNCALDSGHEHPTFKNIFRKLYNILSGCFKSNKNSNKPDVAMAHVLMLIPYSSYFDLLSTVLLHPNGLHSFGKYHVHSLVHSSLMVRNVVMAFVSVNHLMWI